MTRQPAASAPAGSRPGDLFLSRTRYAWALYRVPKAGDPDKLGEFLTVEGAMKRALQERLKRRLRPGVLEEQARALVAAVEAASAKLPVFDEKAGRWLDEAAG